MVITTAVSGTPLISFITKRTLQPALKRFMYTCYSYLDSYLLLMYEQFYIFFRSVQIKWANVHSYNVLKVLKEINLKHSHKTLWMIVLRGVLRGRAKEGVSGHVPCSIRKKSKKGIKDSIFLGHFITWGVGVILGSGPPPTWFLNTPLSGTLSLSLSFIFHAKLVPQCEFYAKTKTLETYKVEPLTSKSL